VAVHFADLHDTPGRMRSKGVIRKQVNWAQSRAFFFWRLRRRLTEFDLANKLAAARGLSTTSAGSKHRREAVDDLKAWFLSNAGSKPEMWEDDRRVMLWLTDNHAAFAAYVAERKANFTAKALAERMSACDAEGLKRAVANLSPEVRAALAAALK